MEAQASLRFKLVPRNRVRMVKPIYGGAFAGPLEGDHRRIQRPFVRRACRLVEKGRADSSGAAAGLGSVRAAGSGRGPPCPRFRRRPSRPAPESPGEGGGLLEPEQPGDARDRETRVPKVAQSKIAPHLL